MVVVVALVAGLPPAGTGTVGPALAQPVDEIDDESSLDAEDVRAPTGGDEDEPRPERRRDYPDPTSVDTPEDFGLPVAPGDSWDLPVPLEPGRPAEAPGSPFRLRVDDARLRGSGKGRVAVDLQQPRDIPGLFSPLFDVDFVDASDRVIEPVTPATLEVDVSGYALGFYGDLARRLEVRWYEDCVDVAVSEEGDGGEAREAPGMVATRCGRVVALPTTFDAESLTISAELDVEGGRAIEIGAAGGVGWGAGFQASSSGFGLSGNIGKSTGSFGATPLSNVADYQVGLFTGSFDTSYPIQVAPAQAGAAPSVSLVYSSGGVDGMSSNTNNQVSTVGVGWDVAAGGSIQRHYVTCKDDVNPPHWYGDFCPLGHEYTLSLNGVSSRLVLESETTTGDYVATFRLESDPIWRIELFNEDSAVTVSNEDAHDEYWVVTTPDGTRYEFGSTSDSVDYAPVYTYGTTEPFSCAGEEQTDHESDPWYENGNEQAPLTLTCQKAWRWNLAKVTDTSDNAIEYSYLQESNWYGIRNGVDEAEYIRASHLQEIRYSDWAGHAGQTRVLFVTEPRCNDPQTGTKCDNVNDLVDTPIDLTCRQYESCINKEKSPTFYSERRLAVIATQVLAGGLWDTVSWWDLDQSYPDPTVGSEPASEAKLWLDAVTRRPGSASSTVDARSAFWLTEAEDYDSKSGSAIAKWQAQDMGEGRKVVKAKDGDWIKFEQVDFGPNGPGKVIVRYSSTNTASPKLRFRIDGAAGTQIAEVDLADTGGTLVYDTVASTDFDVTPTGVHDL
jgi:hypothetical protein